MHGFASITYMAAGERILMPDKLIDFEQCPSFLNDYEGADTKLKIQFNNDIYMLKLGRKLEPNERNALQASYSNSPVAEYLGSHIFQLANIPVQETILGTYRGHIAVGCKDFILDRPDSDSIQLTEFKKLETSFLGGSSAVGRTPLYENILAVFNNHPYLEPIREQAIERYWQTFAIDSLIGNFDRHSGNWGFLYDKSKDQLFDLAPVYDCGSSFYPRLNEKGMLNLIEHPDQLQKRVKTFPTAALKINGSKAKYHEFLISPEGTACRNILLELYGKLDMNRVHELIANTPGISNVQREFYSLYIDTRDKEILQPALEMAREESRERNTNSLEHHCQIAKEASDALANSRNDIASDKSFER